MVPCRSPAVVTVPVAGCRLAAADPAAATAAVHHPPSLARPKGRARFRMQSRYAVTARSRAPPWNQHCLHYRPSGLLHCCYVSQCGRGSPSLSPFRKARPNIKRPGEARKRGPFCKCGRAFAGISEDQSIFYVQTARTTQHIINMVQDDVATAAVNGQKHEQTRVGVLDFPCCQPRGHGAQDQRRCLP